jgi:hypothetical protein
MYGNVYDLAATEIPIHDGPIIINRGEEDVCGKRSCTKWKSRGLLSTRCSQKSDRS